MLLQPTAHNIPAVTWSGTGSYPLWLETEIAFGETTCQNIEKAETAYAQSQLFIILLGHASNSFVICAHSCFSRSWKSNPCGRVKELPTELVFYWSSYQWFQHRVQYQKALCHGQFFLQRGQMGDVNSKMFSNIAEGTTTHLSPKRHLRFRSVFKWSSPCPYYIIEQLGSSFCCRNEISRH